jgi:hypothetical protein
MPVEAPAGSARGSIRSAVSEEGMVEDMIGQAAYSRNAFVRGENGAVSFATRIGDS